jgi:AraC-like DNA-binding protein
MISTLQDQHTLPILPARRTQRARPIIPMGPRHVMRTFDFLDIAGQFPALADIVEDIADWDILDGNIARDVSVTVLPSTSPHFVVQYRAPVVSSRKFGDAAVPHRPYQHVVTMIRRGITTINPHGPLGVIVARLKPEAAACLLGDHLYEFADTKVDLDAVFGTGVVASLAEMLAESGSSYHRIAAVSKFLLANIRSHEPDPVVRRAAASLRSKPFLRLGPLAAELGLSERHLSRRFKAVFGTGPKRFARSARVEHVLAACGSESSWANIACSCGFTDQAHMINDFKAILGATPTHFFRSPFTGEYRDTVQPTSP